MPALEWQFKKEGQCETKYVSHYYAQKACARMEDEMEEMTMDDFKDDIDRSFTPLVEGDIITCTATDINEEEVTVDLNYYTDGVIPLAECSDDPSFSIKDEITCGQELSVMILDTSGERVLLSLKKAKELHIWKELQSDLENHTVFTLKISGSVNGGVIVYVKGMRGFIPASQLSMEYVEDTALWLGRTVEAVIITVDEDSKKLVLSSKAVAKEKAALEKNAKVGRLVPGTVMEGTIEKLESYGVFVNIGEGLTGLVHISQITNRFIKSPKEVVHLGDKVKVKILGIEGDRIRLSIKAVEEEAERAGETSPVEYHDKDADEPSGYMADLLKNIEL